MKAHWGRGSSIHGSLFPKQLKCWRGCGQTRRDTNQHWRATHKFQVGDLVLLKKHNADKMDLRWEPNYRVVRLTSPLSAVVENQINSKARWCNVSDHKPKHPSVLLKKHNADKMDLRWEPNYRVVRLTSPLSAVVENQINGKTKWCNVGDHKPKHPSEDWELKPSPITRAARFINHLDNLLDVDITPDCDLTLTVPSDQKDNVGTRYITWGSPLRLLQSWICDMHTNQNKKRLQEIYKSKK